MSSSTHIHPYSQQLSEQFIQDSFHSYLKSSLTQAKAERLLDADVLASAESDLMITGTFIFFVLTRIAEGQRSKFDSL